MLEYPWLTDKLEATLLAPMQHHALLIQGIDADSGQFEFAKALAWASLCENSTRSQGSPACLTCPACLMCQAQTHPDLFMAVPEQMAEALGVGFLAETNASSSAEKRKPSKEIKVEVIRQIVHFAQQTSSRGKGRVVVIHPAEQLNLISANTLLKTLEEPPGQARFILSTGAFLALLPTIKSRCLSLTLPPPERGQALSWLERHGVDNPAVLLAATGGNPILAMKWHENGKSASVWAQIPQAIMNADHSIWSQWELADVVDAYFKLTLDMTRIALGLPPTYFDGLDKTAIQAKSLAALVEWQNDLKKIAYRCDHPWNLPLMLDSLNSKAHRALVTRT